MSLYSARAKEVSGGVITLTTGEKIKAIGNREFYPGDLVWTDGAYAYGFQGRGGSFMWNDEVEGVPIFFQSWIRAAWIKGKLKYASKRTFDSQYLSNNTKKTWFFAGAGFGHLIHDSYTDDNGLTAVFGKLNGNYMLLPWGEELKGQEKKKIHVTCNSYEHSIFTSEAHPEENHDNTTEKALDSYSATITHLSWQESQIKENIKRDDSIFVYDTQGKLVNSCSIGLTESELKGIAESEFNSFADNILVDKKIIYADVHYSEPRIDNGKIGYKQEITLHAQGYAEQTTYWQGYDRYEYSEENDTDPEKYQYGDWEEITYDTKAKSHYTCEYKENEMETFVDHIIGTISISIKSYIEADFDIDTCRVSNKREIVFYKCGELKISNNDGYFTKSFPAKDTNEDDGKIIEYVKLREQHATSRQTVLGTWRWETDKEEEDIFYAFKNIQDKWEKVKIETSYNEVNIDENTIKYILQDDLFADKNGNIYQGETLLLNTGLKNPQAALKVGDNEWLVISNYYLIHIKDGVTENLGATYNNKLHKFKNIKQFLAGKETP